MAEADLDVLIRSIAKKNSKTLMDAAKKRRGRYLAMAAKATNKATKDRYRSVAKNTVIFATAAARRIQIVRLKGVEGEEIELASHRGERTLTVDGEPQFGSIPALERDEHVVRARRIAGDAWEVEVDPL